MTWVEYKLTQELGERFNDTTPDWFDLKLTENIPVFVYGEEMVGNRYSEILRGQTYLGEAWTSTTNYVMERAESDDPVVFEVTQTQVQAHRIYGEVFLVKPKVMLNLDFLNANTMIFQRSKKFVYLHEQMISSLKPNLRPSVKCWMYLGKTEYWEDQTTKRMVSKDVNNQRVYMWAKTTVKAEKEWDENQVPAFLREGYYSNRHTR